MKTEPMAGPDMSRNARKSITPQLVAGVFIMTLGVLLMLDRLDILAMAARVLRFWPVGLVALGITMLARRDDSHGRFWGFAWLFLGAWLLLNSLGLVRVGFWDLFWPLLMILFGLSLVRQTWRRGDGRVQARATGVGNLFAVLSESKRSAAAGEPFTNAGMTAFMGGCVLDLRQAMLAPGEEAIVDVFGVMGGHEIVVPGGWTVVPDVVNVLSGVEDKRLPALPDPSLPPGAVPPRLVIRGFLLISGVTLKT